MSEQYANIRLVDFPALSKEVQGAIVDSCTAKSIKAALKKVMSR